MAEKRKIKTIEKGWGEGSTYFSTDKNCVGHPTFVHEIKQEEKVIKGNYLYDGKIDLVSIVVYRGYEEPGHKLVFEIEAGSSITLTFKD